MDQYLGIVVMMALAAIVSGALVTLSWVLGPKNVTPYKSSPYECGVTPVGDAKERFPVQFYLIGILFILFDIEVVFLWSWMTVFRESSDEYMAFTFVEFLVYMSTWLLGYLYIIKVGALRWEESSVMISSDSDRTTHDLIPAEHPAVGVGGGIK